MTHKMKHLLVLLLIILKDAGPTTACSSSCSSYCVCQSRGLNSVPQFLPTTINSLYLYGNEITTLRQYDFSSGLLGVAVGTLLVCAILFTIIRCINKLRTREAPSSPDSGASFTNTNLSAAVTVGGQVQTGQHRSNIASVEGYSDVIPSQPGPRQNLNRSDEQGYQILTPSPPPTTGAGYQTGYQTESAAAHGADADALHQYEALSEALNN
uniref:LRRNT domain-containing protein n=1 Tax=Branchiostoma floridae TaxID=7739 RepID=C3ZYN3_BRAFL|eukprot:XP_002586324.1 hypothetical protein BRAFLDRAFT_108979 [Branchiostoma floridae]